MDLAVENWTIQELTGYVHKTTFYTYFSIADKFGASTIQDTYNRAFAEWKNDVEVLLHQQYLTGRFGAGIHTKTNMPDYIMTYDYRRHKV